MTDFADDHGSSNTLTGSVTGSFSVPYGYPTSGTFTANGTVDGYTININSQDAFLVPYFEVDRIMKLFSHDDHSEIFFWYDNAFAASVQVVYPTGSTLELDNAEEEGRSDVFYFFDILDQGESAPLGTYTYYVDLLNGQRKVYYEQYNGEVVTELPQNISAQRQGNTLHVEWSSVQGIDGYEVLVYIESLWNGSILDEDTINTSVDLDGSVYRIGVEAEIEDDWGNAIAYSYSEINFTW